MRLVSIAFAILSVTGSAAFAQEAAPVLQAGVPLEIVHHEGRPLALGLVAVQAGDVERGPVGFRIRFDNSAQDLGPPAWATWTLRLDQTYCRNQPTWVEAVLTAPSGQSWRGPRHDVEAGPDHPIRLVHGFGGPYDLPGLFEAASQGGRFTLAFENSQGERWNETAIEMPDAGTQETLFDRNRAALRRARPADVPVTRQNRLEYVSPARPVQTAVRPCP